MFSVVFLVSTVRAPTSEVFLPYYIIGLTGRNAAGKGTVATMLEKRSFEYHSLSDTLRNELKKRGIDESREELTRVGNELRKSRGPGVLADLMIDSITSPTNHIVDSVRNPFEVESLARKYEEHAFYLLSVDAKPEIRFQRLMERSRSGDSTTWKQFLSQEALEENSDDPNKQQLFLTMAKADFSIDNSGNLEDLERNIDNILDKL